MMKMMTAVSTVIKMKMVQADLPVMMTVVLFIWDMVLLQCKSDSDVSRQLDVI